MPNILVIDDEKSIACMLYQALTKYGYNVETATDGQEGIKKFVEGQFDLVITDILILGLMAMTWLDPSPTNNNCYARGKYG
ncbi:MAG: response regulator [Desulfobacteraceae bacterium]|nr:response regulator [Desulfobacteraceae bacterium]